MLNSMPLTIMKLTDTAKCRAAISLLKVNIGKIKQKKPKMTKSKSLKTLRPVLRGDRQVSNEPLRRLK